MKKQLFGLLLASFWLNACLDNTVKNGPAVAANSTQNVASSPESTPPTAPNSSQKQPQKSAEPLVNPNKMQGKGATTQSENVTKAAPATHGTQPKPRPVLPDDAMCFIAKENSGKVSEIRLVMQDKKKIMGDLLVHNVQTREFAQGRVVGELREQGQVFLTWSFNDVDNVRQIINLSFLLKGDKLTQKSRDADDEGRVFLKTDCGALK
jgi:hypothetical protein